MARAPLEVEACWKGMSAAIPADCRDVVDWVALQADSKEMSAAIPADCRDVVA